MMMGLLDVMVAGTPNKMRDNLARALMHLPVPEISGRGLCRASQWKQLWTRSFVELEVAAQMSARQRD